MLDQKTKKILINRTDALGDTLLSFPVGMFLKKNYPNSEVTFLISSRFGDLANIIKGDISFVTYQNQKGPFLKRLSYLKQLFSQLRPTYFLQMGGERLPLFYSWLSRVSFRGGLKSKMVTFLFMNRGVRQKRRVILKHETIYNLELLAPLFPKINFESLDINDYLPNFDFEKVVFDKTILPSKKFMVIHPGMSGHSLNWPMSHYAQFMAKWDEKYNGDHDFVLSFTPSDLAYVNELEAELKKYSFKGNIHHFDGSKNGLAHYAKYISHADYFIGPSTGTTHLAGLIGIKTIGIFSPIRVQRKERWGILGKRALSVSTETFDLEAQEAREAMAKISPDSVILKLEQLS